MSDQSRVPEAGDRLTTDQVEMILEAVQERSRNFPDEPDIMTVCLVMLNIGDRFTPVSCVNGEWEGIKRDIPKGEGVPKCPNGHVMMQGQGVTLGWVPAL